MKYNYKRYNFDSPHWVILKPMDHDIILEKNKFLKDKVCNWLEKYIGSNLWRYTSTILDHTISNEYKTCIAYVLKFKYKRDALAFLLGWQ